ncbi:Nitrilase [Colletotrichum fioriniae]|uniref:Nitrilase n=1 Tax=Colletotrichum fioriniae TaxID=710243 RepID=UPI0032DBCF17|nr:Nitrilase [Colletotrichum fioriniae]
MVSTRPIVKVAAVQAAPVSFDLEKSLQKLRREWYAKYVDSAVEVPSPAFDRLCETARANNVLLHVGIIEKAGGTLYCTALLLDREGKLVYKHRKVTRPIYQLGFETNKYKLIPTAAERLVWGRGAGDGLLVKPTDVGRVGSLIWLAAPSPKCICGKEC